jgi:voltage-gated potassium channel
MRSTNNNKRLHFQKLDIQQIIWYFYKQVKRDIRTQTRSRVMEFTLWFIHTFFWMLVLASPLLVFLGLLVFLFGLRVNKIEGWNLGLVGTFYYSFITATTIGYGDFCPKKKLSRVLAIVIGFIGLVLTGIVVAIGLKSAEIGLRHLAEDENKSDVIQFYTERIYRGLENRDPA